LPDTSKASLNIWGAIDVDKRPADHVMVVVSGQLVGLSRQEVTEEVD
jgi:hypothetical protein